MGELHATINISLDACCDHTQVIADDEFHQRIAELFEGASALLFGRKTYDLLHSYWPRVASSGAGTPAVLRLARILDQKPKYVVSSGMPASDWNARQTEPTADAITALKDDTDGTLLLVASPTLARTLLHWGLVDQYHVVVSPMIAGRGPRFLEGVSDEVDLSLLDVTRLRSGSLILRYGVGSGRQAM